MLRAALVIAALAAPAAADDAKDLIGSWKVETATLGGKDVGLKGTVLTIEAGGKYSVKLPEATDKGTITYDEKATPKGMEIVSETDGPLKGKKLPAIYEMKDDRLTICYDMDFKAKPAKFEAAAGTNHALFVYVREKK